MNYWDNAQRVLARDRVSSQLDSFLNYPLTLVVAAMGYGKTMTVKNFLDGKGTDYVWISLESDQSSIHRMWDVFARQFAEYEPDLGDTLSIIGFPAEAEQRERFADLLEEWAYMKKKVLVIDDYHNANSPELDLLVEVMVRRRINGLNLMILSRNRPSINVQELVMKGYCYQLQSSLFELSSDEIKEYFHLFDLEITDEIAQNVQRITEGWVTAVYLLCRNYMEQGVLKTGADMNELIETTILKRYSIREKELLMKLSILSSFTPEQVTFITEDEKAAVRIQELSRDNSFLRFDQRSEKYVLHNIFGSYLMAQLEKSFDGNELKRLYRRCGEWFLTQGLILPGINWLLRAEEFDLIMEQFERPRITSMLSRLPAQEIVNLFEQVPLQARYLHPIGYITYIDFYISRVDAEKGALLLQNFENFVQGIQWDSISQKMRIEGEIELVKIYLAFNDSRKMAERYKKAYVLLDGRSRIANPDMIFTFGCPSTLHLYHREKGDLLNLVTFAEHNYRYYEELSGGCGKGYEDLILAEYFLEVCDMKQAELHAYRAIYKAETLDQIAMIINATFVLSRMHAAQGKIQEAKDLLHELSAKISDYKSPILMNTVDLCYGYLGGITGEPESFARWIQRGNIKREEMFYHGFTFYYLVQAKYLLLQKEYIKLEVYCSEMQHIFPDFHIQLGFMHAHILDAIAKYHLYGLAEGKEALKMALDIGREDNVVLPFAEYSEYITDMLRDRVKNDQEDVYVARVLDAALKYRKNLGNFLTENTKMTPLTEREGEIVKLLAQGYHNKEIAEKLFIAEITVKKTITSIYRKLGVSSRAAAVRKVMELKMI
jgi:LuxR family transcriptional regulator, maltose regulon positive regulatory protein